MPPQKLLEWLKCLGQSQRPTKLLFTVPVFNYRQGNLDECPAAWHEFPVKVTAQDMLDLVAYVENLEKMQKRKLARKLA